ncbi:MAG TPA: glycoside hydrolase family 3 N-terminal domain-containing protein [Candidatus Binatia bacterium]|nr:glycoside hydrolase family 3 N-terminal domain-containing protein [Candidatus Binatia bacterium]
MLVLLVVLAPLLGPSSAVMAQSDDGYLAQAQQMLEQMTVAERVGQLFLVTFAGDATGRSSDIANLIVDYKIGGVVLLAENDNIVGEGDAVPLAVTDLNNRLQRLALLGDASTVTSTVGSETVTATPGAAVPGSVPLLIATQQDGDGAPYSQIRYGLSQLPAPMAIGATWEPQYAAEVGQILGRELSAIGVNLLLGPSLDVLENPNPENASDLGVRTFGGDPYWVGLMGQAYTSGVHDGSNGRVAVIGKHFPGRGSSDRPLDDEVSTVRKSLEQLKQVELAPFFLVTGNARDAQATADGLLVTHIRYQGFQGNLRDTTAPVSFDPPALQTLMALPEFSGWRNNGGVMVSDSLGVRAVQRFYDNSGQEFPHRQVAKDALLAGNDLLYIDQFALEPSNMALQMANLRDSITWFQEKYLTDPAFQQRVDDAVLHILRLKLKIYGGDFSVGNVLVDPQNIAGSLRQSQASLLGLAQAAVTLIAPSQEELQERLPRPPGPEDQIVVFTDVRQWRQCSECAPESYIGQDSLQDRILALYGPSGSAQISPQQIISFSFADLDEFLQAGPGPIPPPTPDAANVATTEPEGAADQAQPTPTVDYSPEFQVQSALQNAEWVIFATLDTSAEWPQSSVLKRFLAQRPDIVRNTRTVVFAYNAPYYLDTTEVSKLTAYYGIYSKIDAFIDTSVRTLFQEQPAPGAPPVDIRATDYELFDVTQPAANQVIDLFVVRSGSLESPPSEEPLELVVGDTLRLRTGVIVDHNGNPVPDGTPVQFVQQDRLQGFISVIGERPTIGGVAELDYVLEARTGQFRITANAGSATSSQQLDIAIGENVRVVVVTLTPAPTTTVTNTPEPTLTPQPTSTVRPTAAPTAIPEESTPPPLSPNLLDNALMMLGVISGIFFTNILGFLLVRASGPWNRIRFVRVAGWGLVLGLAAYNYYALQLPGASVLQPLGSWAAPLTTSLGGLLGISIGWQQGDQNRLSGQGSGAPGD